MTRTYELGLVIEPRQSDDAVQEIVAKYREMIESKGGTITNVENWGNTSSSTIPIALAEHLATRPEGLGGLVAFGAGLTSGAAIVEFIGNA